MIHLDSSLLIDLQRETARDRPGPAFDALEAIDDDEVLGVSVHVLCELRVGAELARKPAREHDALDRLLSGLVIAYPDKRFMPAYARLLSAIERGGRSIAAMDLLIATAAVIEQASLLTRNVKDFSRVPGLRVLGY
ncbi:MAG TPA: type II toxin-antitoxin system VapC family toxin [Vicinamibacterales bacterium]|nr:type II toxin-antitoxin system VapC family toxin [Vicinamibacterales bacterium]